MKEVKNGNRINTNIIYYFLLIFWILFLTQYIWTILYWSWFDRIFISLILLPVYFFWIKGIYDIIKWKFKANNLKKIWILKNANIIEIKPTGHTIISKQKSFNSYKYILKEWNNKYENEESRYVINKLWDSILVYIDNNSKKYWVDKILSYHWFLYSRELMEWKTKESVSLINNLK